MRLLKFLLVFGLIACVFGAKGNLKSLTESMGQEIIEIGPRVRDLPPEIEEEPSAEVDDDGKQVSTMAPPTTKKEIRKLDNRYKSKDSDVEEEEAKIERELAEIYKDSADYKDTLDSEKPVNRTVIASNNTEPEKAVARARTNFKFQPDLNNKQEVEKFRTSVDEISCDQAATKRQMDTEEKPAPDGAIQVYANSFIMLLISLLIMY